MARAGARHNGWLTFAGVMLTIAGGLNVIHGITAIHNSNYFTNQVLYHNLTAWGWVFLIWGVLQAVAGLGSLSGQKFGPYLGVILAGISAIMWFFFLFASPFAAIVGVTVNVFVIYGLTVGATDAGLLDD
jgi:hypothetical protein